MTNEPSAIMTDTETTGARGGATGSPAQLNSSHPLGSHLEKMLSAPADARVARTIGELATAMDHAAQGRAFSVAVSAIEPGHRMGLTTITLAALWGRWGVSTCLIELGSGSKSLGGAIARTSPDLSSACNTAASGGTVTGIQRLHSRLPHCGVIAAGDADVMGLLSTGKLKALIESLKQTHDRIVLAAPAISSGFPFLALDDLSDRLVVSLVSGQSRGGPLRELAETAMVQGLRPIEVIWHE
ncbi:MAG: hypothetical protein ACF8PN_13090 [Phycisphaerales bacterium]